MTGNLLGLCGSGSSGCHGAYHGNPYEVTVGRGTATIAPIGYELRSLPARYVERRDAEWVARRIGETIAARPVILAYVKEKLGEDRAREYLARRYYVTVP